MSTSVRRTRNVTVVGGGLIGLSTAINIQENVPGVNVEIMVDVGCNASTVDSSKVMKEFENSSLISTKNENNTDNHFGDTGYQVDDEGCSLKVDVDEEDDHVIGVIEPTSLSTLQLIKASMRAWSNDDVIWLPQSAPGLDDMTGRGGYYRFWSVLTWYHLYEMTKRESSLQTGVRLLSNYKLGQWKDSQVSDWWKDLVPDYRILQSEAQHKSGLRYSRSFTTVVMNKPRYLRYLTERFLSCGGRLSGRHQSSSSEFSAPCDLLVNCSGMNIDELTDRPELQAVQSPKLQPTTSIQTLNSTQCCQFEDIHLETGTITHNGRLLPVVHNYGYDSDLGVTLHWGCAQETARLVSDILAGRSMGLASKL